MRARFLPAAAILAVLGGPAFAGEYSSRIWRTEEGLPQNRIQSITQTTDGYLWIGTFEGLARFDGTRFAVFDRSNTPAFADNSILSLEPAVEGGLWIGTEGGGLLRYSGGEFRSFGLADGLTNGFVRSLLTGRDGTLWVGTDRGFFKRAGDRFVRLDGTPEAPLVSVKYIAEDPAGRIWVAGFPGLLGLEHGRLEPVSCGKQAASPGLAALLLRERMIADGCEARPPELPNEPITTLLRDRSGALWTGTPGRGLLRLKNGTETEYSAPSALSDNAVATLFEDRQHNIWVGLQDGLVRFSRAVFSTLTSREGLADDNVSTVYEDRQRTLWMVTYSGQIYRLKGSTPERYRLPGGAKDFVARTIYEDSRGVIWIGGTGSSLIRMDHGRVTRYTKADGLRGNTVRQIFEDPAGTIWLGTDSGMNRWGGHGFTRYYLEDGLSYPSVRCLAADSNGDILAGTDAGLNRIHDGRIVADPAFAPLKQEKIWSIYVEGDRLWLGTRGGGLVLLRRGKLTRFRMKDGLTSDSMYQILDDGHGKFWMSEPSGLSSVSRDELDRFAAGKLKVVHAVAYGRQDGMESSQMYAGVQPAGCRRASGELWFPTVRGAVRVDPRDIPAHSESPALIERIVAGDTVLPMAGSGEIAVPPGRGRVAIDFTAPDLAGSQRVNFRYKLEGFDDDWMATKSRTAYYSNLPPGHYRFRVIAMNAAAAAAGSEAAVSLYWKPAFHETPWFYGLCAVLGLLAGWAGLWIYARQTRARYAMRLAERTRVAREMHDTVIQGCVGISTLLEAAGRTQRCDAAEAGNLLDEARAQIKATVEEARQAVWDLRHYEEGVSAVDRLFEFAQKAGAESGIRVDASVSGDAALVDPAIDRALLLAGREAVRNAVRHAHPGWIRLTAAYAGEWLTLEIADDGAGFDAGPGREDDSHFGIQGMRERIEQTGGSFELESGAGRGTRVRMAVPLGSRADSANALNAAPLRAAVTFARFRGSGQ